MSLGVQFFTAAKDQHESGAKWSLIVLVVLLYFHLAIAGPFARQTAAKAEIDQRVTANQKIEAQLDPIVTSADTLVKDLETQVNEASSVLRDDLVAHFRSLDDVIGKLLKLKPQDAEGDPGAQFFAPPESQQQQQQQQQPAARDVGRSDAGARADGAGLAAPRR